MDLHNLSYPPPIAQIEHSWNGQTELNPEPVLEDISDQPQENDTEGEEIVRHYSGIEPLTRPYHLHPLNYNKNTLYLCRVIFFLFPSYFRDNSFVWFKKNI